MKGCRARAELQAIHRRTGIRSFNPFLPNPTHAVLLLTVTIAERQADMLAPTILECLDPVKLARELVH